MAYAVPAAHVPTRFLVEMQGTMRSKPVPTEPNANRLPEPEVVSSYFDDGFAPRLAAMCLRWPEEPACLRASLWKLPDNVRLISPVPQHFGVRILRHAEDCYDVCLVWDRQSLHWPQARRAELIGSGIEAVLAALGTEMQNLLEQPIAVPLKAAA